jgi:uncharacterized protein YxjI
MKSLYLKQRIFTLVDRYFVYDAAGSEIYRIEGQFLSIPKRQVIYDAAGRELFTLRRIFFALLPTFVLLDPTGKELATIRKRFTLFRHQIDIDSSFGSYSIEGNFLSHDFSIHQNGRQIVSMHKKWLSWGDTYEIQIEDEANAAFVCALVIAVDQAIHEQSGNHRH